MKMRLCDCCKQPIRTKYFYKICKSEQEGATQKLINVADGCDDCFNRFVGGKNDAC